MDKKKDNNISKLIENLKYFFGPKKVDVDFWTMQYGTITEVEEEKALPDGEITILETGKKLKTNKDGYITDKFKPGEEITPIFCKDGWPSVQGATIKVPTKHLTGHFNEVTFQVPLPWIYNALKHILIPPKKNCSHIVTTIQSDRFNMHNDRGLEGAKVYLEDENGIRIEADLYPGQEKARKGESVGRTDWVKPSIASRLTTQFKELQKESKNNKIIKRIMDNPLAKKITLITKDINDRYRETSHDGAAVFLNLPKDNKRYTLIAEKDCYRFSKSTVFVSENSPTLINVSPPHAPRGILLQPTNSRYIKKPKKPKKTKNTHVAHKIS